MVEKWCTLWGYLFWPHLLTESASYALSRRIVCRPYLWHLGLMLVFLCECEGPIVHTCALVNFMNAVSSQGPARDIWACKVWALQSEEWHFVSCTAQTRYLFMTVARLWATSTDFCQPISLILLRSLKNKHTQKNPQLSWKADYYCDELEKQRHKVTMKISKIW